MQKTLAALLLCVPLLGGCTTVAQFAAGAATSLSSSTPAEVRTYAEATQAATLATNAVDVAINVHKFDKATLTELSALNDGVHAAWLFLKADNDAGHSLVFGSFQAAFDAFSAYATAKGVSH